MSDKIFALIFAVLSVIWFVTSAVWLFTDGKEIQEGLLALVLGFLTSQEARYYSDKV